MREDTPLTLVNGLSSRCAFKKWGRSLIRAIQGASDCVRPSSAWAPTGSVKLRRYSGDRVQRGSASCRDGRGTPLRCRFRSEDAKRRPGDEMALEVEGVMHGGVTPQSVPVDFGAFPT
jgi:hypothetical protein